MEGHELSTHNLDLSELFKIPPINVESVECIREGAGGGEKRGGCRVDDLSPS